MSKLAEKREDCELALQFACALCANEGMNSINNQDTITQAFHLMIEYKKQSHRYIYDTDITD